MHVTEIETAQERAIKTLDTMIRNSSPLEFITAYAQAVAALTYAVDQRTR